VLGAAIAGAALVAYEFVRYPGLVTGAGTWLALATFAGMMVGFVAVTGVTTRDPRISTAGLVASCMITTIWIVVGVVVLSVHSKGLVFVLLALPLMSVAVGMIATWRGSRASGLRTAVVAAVVASLVVFLVLAADTSITDGRPYDAGQLRDFASSGYPDLATYAVSDSLGTAMVLLLFMSVANAVLGAVGAALAKPRD